MNSSILDRKTLLIVVALLGPFLALQGAYRLNLPTGPSLSQAAVDEAPQPVHAAKRDKQSAEQIDQAISRDLALDDTVLGNSPLYFPNRTSSGVQKPVEIAPDQPELPTAMLSSVFRAANGQRMAVINGKLHREGDTLIDSWKLLEVNCELRHVILTGPKSVRIKVDMQGMEILDDEH